MQTHRPHQDKSFQVDMCHGPLFSKMFVFFMPLAISNILHVCFNGADLIVLGQFCPHEAVAAVGSSAAFFNLMLNLFFGLSMGTNVLVANAIGANDKRKIRRTVHTSIWIAIVGGVLAAIIAAVVTKPGLQMLYTPDNVIDRACEYMWILCVGIPFVLLFSFGSAVLRAMGDTRHPMYFLIYTGVLNVILNLLFVLVFKIDVAGVAWATVISQIVSAVLVVRVLMKSRDQYRLYWNKLKVYGSVLPRLLSIGLPGGFQGAMYSLSNMIIQSAFNHFGSQAMAGNMAATNLEGILYSADFAVFQTVVSFAGQNYGANNFDRIKKTFFYGLAIVIISVMSMAVLMIVFRYPLMSIYTTDAEVIKWGCIRIEVMFSTYFLLNIMDTLAGTLRGLGSAIVPAINVFLFTCVYRVIWATHTITAGKSMVFLLCCYPISWTATAFFTALYFWYLFTKLKRKAQMHPLPI